MLMNKADTSPPGQDLRGGQELIPTSINIVGFLHLALKVSKDAVGDYTANSHERVHPPDTKTRLL